ncbi:hypothetical protein [Iningainema tapete]|uniref:Uncharacterized protein n=1 Tax=Iningainema tapete BLCC-T55 TaxID=2748662 RepID=A0A8J6XMB1_9CYAN|nr:hypothetical protein [Iningainema tapete]MBD2775767.1 hypothetical protein [Iningainema tapete BLCC-T55]
MSNPNPVQTQAFKDRQYQGYTEDWLNEPLAKQVTGVKLPQSIYEALRSLSAEERVKYLRRVISEAVKRDLLAKEE